MKRRDKTGPPGLDFEDLIARIEAVDPDALSPDARAEAARMALHAPGPASDESSTALRPFIAAARADLDRMAASTTTPSRPPAPAKTRRSARRRVGFAIALASAAAAIGVAAPAIQHAFFDDGSDDRGMAFHGRIDVSDSGVEVDEAENPAGSTKTKRTSKRDSTPEFEPEPELEPEPEPLATVDVPVPPVRLTLDQRVRRMERRADASWKSGDLDGAIGTLEEIIQLSGRRVSAEYAYADLLSIARQRGDEARRDTLRREYLMRFSNGRFADDIRADRCRSAKGGGAACWQDYLRQHPRGSHADEATRLGHGTD